MAEQKYPGWVWHNGKIVPWAEATVHVMSHSLQYGSAIFEGIRCYKTPKGGAIFRLAAHMKRLYNSARIYDMPMPFTIDQVTAACHEVLKKNGFEQAYLRPCAFRGLGGFGISADTPVQITIAGWPMGPYLGPEALKNGPQGMLRRSKLTGIRMRLKSLTGIDESNLALPSFEHR